MILKLKSTAFAGSWHFFEIDSFTVDNGVMYPYGEYTDYRIGKVGQVLSLYIVNRKGEGQKIVTDNEAYLLSDIGKTIEKLN